MSGTTADIEFADTRRSLVHLYAALHGAGDAVEPKLNLKSDVGFSVANRGFLIGREEASADAVGEAVNVVVGEAQNIGGEPEPPGTLGAPNLKEFAG